MDHHLRQKGTIMDDMMRKAVEKRALDLWRNAGAPSRTGLEFWLQAELELGAIEKVEPDDPFLILGRLAAHTNGTPVAGPGRVTRLS